MNSGERKRDVVKENGQLCRQVAPCRGGMAKLRVLQ